jgi:hypothetical protein
VDLELERVSLDLTGESTEEFLEEYERALPPIVNAKANLEPEAWEGLRADILALYEETNAADDGSYRQRAEYLLIKGRKAG